MTSAATRRRIEGDRPKRQDPPLTADEVVAMIEAMPTTVLLTTAYALTHAIHESERTEVYSADVQRSRDLRAQRDQLTAEVLRRTGGE